MRLLTRTFLNVVNFTFIALVSYAGSGGGEEGGSPFPSYEVGDIVIFGPASEKLDKVGHSALLGPRQNEGTGDITLRDAMPLIGTTENTDLAHGDVEGIITVTSLADGTWTQAKEDKRWEIWNAALGLLSKSYIIYDPPKTSDMAWSYIWKKVTDTRGEDYVIQSDSIYATPPGSHDYKPRQKGEEVSRYTCCGFTESVYELCGIDLTPADVEFTESNYNVWAFIFPVTAARAWVFWPSRQLSRGTPSRPVGPEVTVTKPLPDVWINFPNILVSGTAMDVSKLRGNAVNFIHIRPDGTQDEIQFDVDEMIHHYEGQVVCTDGNHKLKVKTYDQAGNLSEEFKDGGTELHFKVDTKKPIGRIVVNVFP
jgi:hypothetical protein